MQASSNRQEVGPAGNLAETDAARPTRTNPALTQRSRAPGFAERAQGQLKRRHSCAALAHHRRNRNVSMRRHVECRIEHVMSGAIAVPPMLRTSVAERTSIGMPVPLGKLKSIDEVGAAT